MVDDKSLAEQLLNVLKNGEDSDRIDACFTLSELKMCEVADLLPYLKDTNYKIRQYTARALGELGDPEAMPQLLEVLDDPNWQVRGYAVLALKSLGNYSTLDEVLQAVQDENHEFVILCVLDWIKETKHPSEIQKRFIRKIAGNPISSKYLHSQAG